MKSLIQLIEANAEFVFSYGNIVLITSAVLILSMDYLLAKKTKTLIVKVARWVMVLLLCVNGALIYCINFPLKPVITTLASIDKVTGKEIEDVEFINVRTGEVNRLSDLKSEYIIVNLWGTFCPPCVRELPDLMKIENKYGDKLTVVALSNEDQTKIVNFLQDRQAPSIVGAVLDQNWMDTGEFLPISIFIKNNLVVKKHFGQLSYEEIERICCLD